MRAAYPHTEGYATNPTDGVRVFYEVFGPRDARRTLLFLPAWTMVPGRIWKAQVPYFSRSGFRVVTFDNRGVGETICRARLAVLPGGPRSSSSSWTPSIAQ